MTNDSRRPKELCPVQGTRIPKPRVPVVRNGANMQVHRKERQHTSGRREVKQTPVDKKADSLVQSETMPQESVESVPKSDRELHHPKPKHPESQHPKTEQPKPKQPKPRQPNPKQTRAAKPKPEEATATEPEEKLEQASQEPGQSEQPAEREEDTIVFGVFKTRRVITEEDDQDEQQLETISTSEANIREQTTDVWVPEMLSPKDVTLTEQIFDMKLYLKSPSVSSDTDPNENYQCLREQLQRDWSFWSVLKRDEYHQDFLEWVESRRGVHRWDRIFKRAGPITWVTRRKIWNKARRDCLAEIEREREDYFMRTAKDLESRFPGEDVKGGRWIGVRKDHFPIPKFGHMREHSRMTVRANKEPDEYPSWVECFDMKVGRQTRRKQTSTSVAGQI